MTTASYFEIPVTDLARAIDFYGYVFGVELELTAIDGVEMALFPDATGTGGASGALAKGDSYVPSVEGTRIYFRVGSIDDTLARAIEQGGKELYPKTSIGDLGFVAEFQDCEGNRIALSSGGNTSFGCLVAGTALTPGPSPARGRGETAADRGGEDRAISRRWYDTPRLKLDACLHAGLAAAGTP